MTENGSLLCKVAHAFLRALEHRQICDVLIIQIDLSCIWNDQTCDHVETSGLTCSVRAEESNNLSLLDLHGNAFYHGSRAIFLN